MNDSLQLSDPHFFQEMRTFSTGNSKKKMHMLSVIDRYTVNEVVIDLWRGAGVKFERAEERERERESDRKLLKIQFPSNNISAAESRIAKKRKAFCRRKLTLFGDFSWI